MSVCLSVGHCAHVSTFGKCLLGVSVYDIVYVCVCVCLFVCLHVLINHVELEVIEINSSFANSHSFFPVVCLSVCLFVYAYMVSSYLLLLSTRWIPQLAQLVSAPVSMAGHSP